MGLFTAWVFLVVAVAAAIVWAVGRGRRGWLLGLCVGTLLEGLAGLVWRHCGFAPWFGLLFSSPAAWAVGWGIAQAQHKGDTYDKRRDRSDGYVAVTIGGAVLVCLWTWVCWWSHSDSSAQAKNLSDGYVRGVVRDLNYLTYRLSEQPEMKDLIVAEPGQVWRPDRILTDTATKLEAGGFHDLRAGYTLEVSPKAEGPGWVVLSRLTPEAQKALAVVLQQQAAADQPAWPGHWNDPANGWILPLRFYWRSDGKAVRVSNHDVLFGPDREVVFDLSLYHGNQPEVERVKAAATDLGRGLFDGKPYDGRVAPKKHYSLF